MPMPLMAEMPHAGKAHDQIGSIGRLDHVGIADGAARLNDRRDPGLSEQLDEEEGEPEDEDEEGEPE